MTEKKPDEIVNAAFADLREKLGLTTIEFNYAIGRLLLFGAADATRVINAGPLAYMVRLLDAEPGLVSSLTIHWPEYKDAYDAVESVWAGKKFGRLTDRKFAILCGVTPWTLLLWKQKKTVPAQTTIRLFYYLCELIRRKGGDGLELYLQCVDKDLRSRGFDGGLAELFKPPRKKNAASASPSKDEKD